MANSLAGRKVRTVDDNLRVFQQRDLNSAVIGQVPQGVVIQLGAASEIEGREWVETAMPDGTAGYLVSASVRSHTEATPDGSVPRYPVWEPPPASPPTHFDFVDENRKAVIKPTEAAPGLGLKKTVQDLIVTGFGIMTSGLTALILALAESKLGFAIYSFMWWFVIPIGALCSGLAAASGYYFGSKLFHHRPTRLLLFNMISVALTTYILLNYLSYSFAEVEGHHVSSLIPFGQYMDNVLTHHSMEFRWRTFKLFETGELGNFGYLIATLQILGFAVGGFCVYGHLRSEPYCGDCGKYLRKHSSLTRYSGDAARLQDVYGMLVAELEAGHSSAAIQVLSSFGATKPNVDVMKLSTKLLLSKCPACHKEYVATSINHWNGKDWQPITDFQVSGFLPRLNS